MSERVIMVLGDSFANESPRARRLQAERTVEKVLGKKRAGPLARLWHWLKGGS